MNPVSDFHRYVAYSVPAGFAILALLAIYYLVSNREAGRFFWGILAAVQAVLLVQVLVGGILFLTGLRPQSNGPQWLHYVYGGLFPAGLLVFAHLWGRKNEGSAFLAFGIVAFVCFGLTFRALQTGLGID